MDQKTLEEMNELAKIKKLFFAARINQFNFFKSSGYEYNRREINLYNLEGKTPLFFTCKNKNLDFTRHLVDLKADIFQMCDLETGDYPIHVAF